MITLSKEGIEYDTDWIKDTCVTCPRELHLSTTRYEAQGNYCDQCCANATSESHKRKWEGNDSRGLFAVL